MNEINCGSFCIKQIIENLGYAVKVNPEMFWVCELATFLKRNTDLKIVVHYYNSNLMKDYFKNVNCGFEGFKYIKEMFELGIELKEIILTEETLDKELREYKYIVLNVESRLLNNDNGMCGGHFILLEKRNSKIVVGNPQKEKMINMNLSKSDILRLCRNFGSWRILIKE